MSDVSCVCTVADSGEKQRLRLPKGGSTVRGRKVSISHRGFSWNEFRPSEIAPAGAIFFSEL